MSKPHADSAIYAELTYIGADGYALLAREADDDVTVALVVLGDEAEIPKSLLDLPRHEWINLLDLPVEYLTRLHQSRSARN